MKVVIDKSIPFIEGVFEPYAEVVYIPGPEIVGSDIKDADALIIRTRTKCNEKLLAGSKVRIIATVTAATNNIDHEYCKKHGIFVQNASGCNAGAVANYVFSALYGAAAKRSISFDSSTLGIIGWGQVGQRVESMGRSLGFKILRNDPIKAATEMGTQFCSLDKLLKNSDIVTLHLPLNEHTRGLANAGFFSKMKKGAFFINTSQGDLVVEEDLIEAIPKLGPVIIDAWSQEPSINTRLMNMVDIATPHIASYSLQGKQIGTSMAVRAVARFFKFSELYEFFPQMVSDDHKAVKLEVSDKSQGQIAAMLQYTYPIFTDDFMFRMSPAKFLELRTNYRYRREFFF